MKKCSVFIMLIFIFSIAYAEAAGKDKKIPFDFPDLKQEDVAKRYVKHAFKDRKNPLFRFEMIFPKDWKVINIKEPSELPENGGPVEIGAFHRFKVPDDPKSDILAGIYITAVRVPAEWTDVQALDNVTSYLMKGHSFRVLQSKEYKLSRTTLKDMLITYKVPKDKTYWSRITGFKVKDDTRAYASGKKDILYLVQLNTSEKDYKAFAAEAFYMAKVSLRLE
ncbi:MAG: hypothetical protein HPY65_07115 [Syntrophaceae bacterium]|nr:hypothetical protein [Syntrophaceae bacterium]